MFYFKIIKCGTLKIGQNRLICAFKTSCESQNFNGEVLYIGSNFGNKITYYVGTKC